MRKAETNHALQIRYTLRAFTRALAVVAESVELTAAEFRLLRTLAQGEGMTQAELATQAAMDRPYVSALVRRMIGRGLLRSQRNTQDRRRTDIALSAKGGRLYETLSRQLDKVNAEAVAGIPAAELKIFSAILTRVQSNLDRYK